MVLSVHICTSTCKGRTTCFDAGLKNQMKGWLLEKNKDSPDETESAHTDRLEVDITRGNLKNLSMEKAHPSASVALPYRSPPSGVWTESTRYDPVANGKNKRRVFVGWLVGRADHDGGGKRERAIKETYGSKDGELDKIGHGLYC